MRAEVSAADAQNRTIVTSNQAPFSTTTQAIVWAPRALAGFTWTNQDQLSIMAEYYYNGLGFIGNDYAQLIAYSQSLRSTPGSGPDLLDQSGTFSAAQHYGFVRVSGKIDDKLTAAGWTEVNLQDLLGSDGHRAHADIRQMDSECFPHGCLGEHGHRGRPFAAALDGRPGGQSFSLTGIFQKRPFCNWTPQ